MHTHGGGGRDFIEGSEDAFRAAVNAHMKHGTTTIYPTLSSSTIPTIEAACQACEKLMAEKDSPVLGLHIEGSYINPKQAGAQNPVLIKAPLAEEYEPLLDKYSCIKRWDEAPELQGSVEFITACRKHGVLTALTCTRATYEDVVAAHDAGPRRGGGHLYIGCRPHRIHHMGHAHLHGGHPRHGRSDRLPAEFYGAGSGQSQPPAGLSAEDHPTYPADFYPALLHGR